MDPGYGSIAGVGPDTCGSALVRPCRVAVEAQRRLALSGAAACRPPPKTEANAAHRWREPDSAFNSPLVHNPTPLGARFPPGPVLCMRSLSHLNTPRRGRDLEQSSTIPHAAMSSHAAENPRMAVAHVMAVTRDGTSCLGEARGTGTTPPQGFSALSQPWQPPTALAVDGLAEA